MAVGADPALRAELQGLPRANAITSDQRLAQTETQLAGRRGLTRLLSAHGMTKRDFLLATLTAREVLRYMQWHDQKRPSHLPQAPQLSNPQNSELINTDRPLLVRYREVLFGAASGQRD